MDSSMEIGLLACYTRRQQKTVSIEMQAAHAQALPPM